MQTAKGIGDHGIGRIARLNGILYLLDVGSKTTSFSSAFAGIGVPTVTEQNRTLRAALGTA